MNLQSIIRLVIIGLVLLVLYLVVGMFVHGQILLIVGIILLLVFLLYVLKTFGIV
jgi:hypothetical protein